LGKLGWTEKEYFTCSPYMFFAACEGYFDKVDEQQMMFRRLAEITHKSMGGKADSRELWPLWGDKQKAVDTIVWGSKDEADDLRKRIEKAHGIKLS